MKIRRINKETTYLYFKPITSQRYVRAIAVYDDETFDIECNHASRRRNKDMATLATILYEDNLISRIVKQSTNE